MPNKSPSRRAAGLLVLAILLDGCARAPAPAPVTEIRVSAAAYAAAPRRSLSVVATLCDGVTGDCEFGDAVAAEPDVADGVLVWDYGRPLRRYDRTGHRLPDLGRKGKGPGEYEIAVAAGRSGDSIAVVDIASLRIARFDSGGGFIRFDPLRNIPQTTRAMKFVQGDLVVHSIQPRGDGAGSTFRSVRMRADGSDTLARHELPGYLSKAGQFQEVPGLFSARPVWAVRPDGTVLVSPGSSYEIWEYRNGTALRQVTVEQAPRPVEQSEIDRERERRLARAIPAMRAALEDAMRRAATTHPSVTELVALKDGGILVREAEDVAGDSVRWTRFDSDWHPSGHVVTAASTRVLLVQGERMLMQEQDSAGTALRWWMVP
ncbi:MAG TPA: hypothetical protein VG817_05930 [Gemmatimonadales bacterium]|nr:hypothetical protein [Gemmatimonadales bacterium]